MKSKIDLQHPEIRALVRHAQAERAAWLGSLIGEGLGAAWNLAARAVTSAARGWRGRPRSAAR